MRPRREVLCMVCLWTVVLFRTVLAVDDVDTAWVRTWDGVGKTDVPSAITVDDQGNVYVVGISHGDGTGLDFLTIKYDPDGNLMWDRRYDGPANGEDSAFAVQVDGSGSVYVTGGSESSLNYEDITTLKYDNGGTLIWERRYAGASSTRNRAYALQIDGQGNVYIAGFSLKSQGNLEDYVTLKYDGNGTLLWSREYNGTGSGIDKAVDIDVDGVGNVYVTGHSLGTESDFDDDYLTLKYSPDGTLLWERRFAQPGVYIEVATAVELDPSGNVYVTGWITGEINAYGTLKYDPDGNLMWDWIHEKSHNRFGEPVFLAVDADGNAFVAGRSYYTGSMDDYFAVKCDSDGVLQWEQSYNGPADLSDEARDVKVDAQGNVYVTGYSTDVGINWDFVTVKYNTDADSIWAKRYDGPQNGTDVAKALYVDAAGNVYVTGNSWNSPTAMDFLTIKYSPCTCRCLHQGDGDSDGFITALDLAMIIDVLFGGVTDLQDICCPTSRFDLDCDGFSTALDLSVMIDHLFSSGPGPCDPCSP